MKWPINEALIQQKQTKYEIKYETKINHLFLGMLSWAL